jgi:ArsR family transcriptional regulator, arsenate/arsenite/antimonite-responsive transcriptional repressor
VSVDQEASMYEPNPFERYIAMFKALSDETRLKTIWLLSTIDSKICVSEIMDVLDETQYNVSRHLRVLKNAGLVYEKKEGKWTFYYYRPADDAFGAFVKSAVASIPANLMEQETIRCRRRLEMRVDGKCVVGLDSPEWDSALQKLEKNK